MTGPRYCSPPLPSCGGSARCTCSRTPTDASSARSGDPTVTPEADPVLYAFIVALLLWLAGSVYVILTLPPDDERWDLMAEEVCRDPFDGWR